MKHFFESVEDSPMFRSTASDIEGSIDSLEKRCQRIIKGSKKYQEGIRLFAESQTAFAEYLEEFCGGPDEESMLLGGALMSKFVGVFTELGSYSELLRTQVEVILCEQLQQSWLKGLLLTAKDNQKQLERKTAEYDSARLKHLGHNKVNAKWMQGAPERAQADMLTAEAAAEEARFDVARSLTEVEGRKRYEFLEAVVSSVDAHLRFFENGVQVLKGLEPYLQHSLEVVDVLRREQRERMEGLEQAIAGFSQMKAARVAESAADATSTSATAASNRGPMRVASNMSSVVNELEGFIRTTAESNGAQVTVLKQGYLSKRSSNMRREWKRRFFVLDSAGQLYYFSNKERVDKRKTPQNTVSLLTSTIKTGEDEEERGRPLRYCFRVVSTERSIALQADSEAEMRDWISTIQGVIACLLGGSVNLSKIRQLSLGKPTKPTHSRHGSVSSLDGYDLATTAASFSGVFLDQPTEQMSAGRTASPGLDGATRASMELARAGPSGSQKTWAGSPTSPLRPHITIVQILQQVPGNDRCADCGAADPDWASLNLGCCVCIQCSGVHRRLGVHISKVRSLTLDVKVWEGPVLGMMTALGNAAVNEVWEEALRRINARSDSWVWNDDSDEESSSGRLHAPSEAQPSSPPSADGDLMYLKPSPQHSAAAKEQFITAKYSERRFVVQMPATLSQHSLCTAIASGALKGVMRAVAAGADVNAPLNGPEASQLAAAVEVRVSEAGCASPSGRGSLQPNVSPLLLACQDRHPDAQSQIVEYLLQNGAKWDFRDECGRQPLHYSIIFDRPHLAKSFLQRGADRLAKDAQGRTALDLAIAKGAVADDELLLMLSAEKPTVYSAW